VAVHAATRPRPPNEPPCASTMRAPTSGATSFPGEVGWPALPPGEGSCGCGCGCGCAGPYMAWSRLTDSPCVPGCCAAVARRASLRRLSFWADSTPSRSIRCNPPHPGLLVGAPAIVSYQAVPPQHSALPPSGCIVRVRMGMSKQARQSGLPCLERGQHRQHQRPRELLSRKRTRPTDNPAPPQGLSRTSDTSCARRSARWTNSAIQPPTATTRGAAEQPIVPTTEWRCTQLRGHGHPMNHHSVHRPSTSRTRRSATGV
jgi:hypothetical protein